MQMGVWGECACIYLSSESFYFYELNQIKVKSVS